MAAASTQPATISSRARQGLTSARRCRASWWGVGLPVGGFGSGVEPLVSGGALAVTGVALCVGR